MRRTAITVNYLQMLCLLKVSSSALYDLLLRCLFISSKSCLSHWGTALFGLCVVVFVYFFEELLGRWGTALFGLCCGVCLLLPRVA